MKAVLICPDRRVEVAFLARQSPLALVPVLGPSLLSHWLTHLGDAGIKEVLILAADRPDQIRIAVGRGERWGLRAEVRAESTEPRIEDVRARCAADRVELMDHMPGMPEAPLFAGHAEFFAALKRWFPVASKHRVGAREIAPGIWAGLRCKVADTARIVAPCWLGENVWIRARATVGPHAYVEDSALVDHDAEVTSSWVGPWTYVGALTHVNDSLGWADGLQNHSTGSFTEIVDMFLMGDLRGEHGFNRSSTLAGRLAALLALVLTSPLLLAGAIRNRGSGRPLLERKRAVVPTAVAPGAALREMNYRELNGFAGLARRWPQLWSIVRGDFTWVGNRPLTREQALQLTTEFEQLWLAAPVGFVSLADAYGCAEAFGDDARAHSGYYAVRNDRGLDRAVLRWLIFGSSPGPVN